MTSLQDCLEEVIAKESGNVAGYVIHNSTRSGTQRVGEWDPAALLAHLHVTSPGVLEDHAWMEWHTGRTGGTVGYIHYGAPGGALGHMEVPGYGRLSVVERSALSEGQIGGDLFRVVPVSDGY